MLWFLYEQRTVAGASAPLGLTAARSRSETRYLPLWQRSASRILGYMRPAQNPPYRIGFGFDIHPFKKGGPLILGGVRISSPIGLRGHSDADALLHALCDAILGALSLGDIGQYFPSSDVRWENTPSRIFVQKALQLARQKGYRIGNVDACIICERPMLSPHYPAMRKRISQILKIPEDRIGLKSKTMEGLGSLGKGEGLAAFVSLLLTQA